jgi:hypothetical protein
VSRSGYSDDCDHLNLYRAAVDKAIKGKRGQALLRDLANALDAMPVKSLAAHSFEKAEGEFCTLGVLGAKRGIDVKKFDEFYADPLDIAKELGIAKSMAAEIMEINDTAVEYSDRDQTYFEWQKQEFCGPISRRACYQEGHPLSHTINVRVPITDHGKRRWLVVRNWVDRNLISANQEQPK